jgi:hypothetical protein
MNVIEQTSGVFLRLLLETKEEQQRYLKFYQDACYSGLQVQQTVSDQQPNGSYLLGIWLNDQLVEPLLKSLEMGSDLKDLLALRVDQTSVQQPRS